MNYRHVGSFITAHTWPIQAEAELVEACAQGDKEGPGLSRWRGWRGSSRQLLVTVNVTVTITTTVFAVSLTPSPYFQTGTSHHQAPPLQPDFSFRSSNQLELPKSHPKPQLNSKQSVLQTQRQVNPQAARQLFMPLRIRPSLASTATRRLNHLNNTLSAQPPPSRPFTMTTKTQEPVITSVDDLPLTEAKWITLKKISYTDQTGKPRTWEVATRKTRSEKAGVDAVAMGNILLPPPSQKATKPVSTLLVIQYRPPLDAYTVEWPAGLIDGGEDAETAAVREFREETGYEVSKVLSVSPPQAADPGMTNANMQLVMVEVQLPEGEEMPEQRLEDGEHITRVIVPLVDLYKRLVEYSAKERHVVAAKLLHFAQGMEFMKEQKYF